MVSNVFGEGEEYVCISHMQPIPCDLGDHHLVSNWPTDVARVLSRNDKTLPNGINDRPFVRLPLIEPSVKTFAGSEDDVFFSETYRLLSPSFAYVNNVTSSETTPLDTSAYNTFSYYQIKIVFYASNPVYLPKIKNLVATALL